LVKKRKLFLFPFNCYNSTEILFRSVLDDGINPEEISYLTPSPRKLRATQLLFARLIGKKAFIPPMFKTVGQFAREIAQYAAVSQFFPSELKPLLIRRLLQQKGKKISIGYARTIGNFIADIKRHVRPEEHNCIPNLIKDHLAGYEIPLQRAIEAYNTFLDYDNLLTKLNWLDSEDIIRFAAENLKHHPFLPRVLILDSFVAPNRLEQLLLRALIEHADVTVAGTYLPDKNTTLSEKFIEFINQQHGQHGFVEQKVSVESKEQKPPAFYRFPTPEHEISGICCEILQRAENTGFDQIYVVFPQLSGYEPLVSRIFNQYNIRFTIYPKISLSTSPPIIAVLELLNALDRDYERVATTCAFSSPYFPGLLRLPEDKDDRLRNRTAMMLNSLSRRAGIIKGRDNWYNIAERLIDDKDETTESENLKRLLVDFQPRVRQAIGLTEKILEPAGTIGNQARKLKQFLETVGFGTNLSPELPIYEQLDSDRRALYDILDAIADLELELGKKIEKKGIQEPRSEFIRIVKYLIGLGSKSAEPDTGGVKVVEMEETLGINSPVLFFAGLTENDLPGTYHPDSILPDSLRRALGMPDIEWHRDWQKFHFQRTLQSGTDSVFLSFHQTRDGKPVIPTPFIEYQPIKYEGKNIIFSEVEEQIFNGTASNKRLDEIEIKVNFSDDADVKELLRGLIKSRGLRVTELENYIFCPFQFYLYTILGLESSDEPSFEVDARMWGVIAHKVLARLYKNGPVELTKITQKAKEIIHQELAEIELPSFWKEVTTRILENLFKKIVTIEEKFVSEGFLPVTVEKPIAGKVTNDILLSGRIDRIDRKGNLIRIIDYKTGTLHIGPTVIVEKRTHIQLPIYAYLLLQNDEYAQSVVDNIIVYDLRKIDDVKLVTNEFLLDRLITTAREKTEEVINQIASGNFASPPADKNRCRNCELRFTCGEKEEEMETKGAPSRDEA